MASPFPGMDPYLEDPEIWPGFHATLAVELQRRLNRQLNDQYYADVEILLVRPAPLPVRLRAVRVYQTATRELVTTIEILSPYNKRPASEGLIDYRRKRGHILASRVHLVELDLLRGGERPGFELADDPLDTDYVLLVNRYGLERVSEIWPVALTEPLPLIPVPLLPPDPDVPLDLNAAIREVYASSRYALRINYTLPPPRPSLRPAVETWVQELLARAE